MNEVNNLLIDLSEKRRERNGKNDENDKQVVAVESKRFFSDQGQLH